MTRHAHAFQRNLRPAAQHERNGRVNKGRRHRQGVGQAEARRAPPRDGREHVEDFLQRQIAPAQDVALADATSLGGQQVAGCGIFNRHQVQARIHVGRHPAAEEIQNNPASGRRFPITRADWCSRVDDDYRQACGHRAERLHLGEELRALVVANHFLQTRDGIFVRGLAAARHSDRRHRTGVNESLDSGAIRRL